MPRLDLIMLYLLIAECAAGIAYLAYLDHRVQTWLWWRSVRRTFRRPQNVDSDVDPQGALSTAVGVEPALAEAPPAAPTLVPAVDAVPPQSAAGTRPRPRIHTQSPVGAAARTQLLRSPDSSSPPPR